LTLRGAELLQRADVVVYDYLASPRLLEWAPPEAERVYVGKSASNHALPQERINELLAREAQKGRAVVRLKGGDPYVFGRGGEEALYLFERGIPFEEVPGVSSTVAAAAYAGIPLTHRDYSSQAVLITGHEKADKDRGGHDWSALARVGTLVAVMGRAQLAGLCQNLIKAGRGPQTPAALIEWGATVRQRVVAADLETLPREAELSGLGAPSLLVVGEVASLRDKLCWFERRPLWGKKVLVTRALGQAGKLSALLRELGADAAEKPAFQIRPIEPNPALAEALENLSSFNYLLLTSPNGARIFGEALFGSGRDARALAGLKIGVIGAATGDALCPFGLKADIMPPRFIAEDLLRVTLAEKAGPVLLARALEARDALPVGLSRAGFATSVAPLYETLPAPWDGERDLFEFDIATVTSASCARGLAAWVPSAERARIKVASIGPIATREAKALGFTVAAESALATVASLAEAIERALAPPRK
jgi:uroporphyrinogen III methyltransferase/synthase